MSSAENAQQESRRSLHLWVFLSSPGDVTDERALAKEVIERLESERAHRDRLRLEIVAWDKPGAGTAMPAHLEPQEGLEQGLRKPSACDIVVVIFGYRMGTPLSEKHRKPTGERYWSGTEYEYLDALNAAQQQGIPKILVYRKQGAPNVSLADRQYKEIEEQWQRVEAFFAGFRNADGSFRSYYKDYATPSEFKDRLDEDLRDIVARRLEQQVPSGSDLTPGSPAEEPVWPESPYPGLRPFRVDEAPIFFGRDRETDELVQRLNDPRNRLLVVVGASGSGKSSLVTAGLLPRLQHNAVPGSQDWILDVRFTPGQVGDNALMALAVQLAPKLEKQGKQPRELAAELAAQPDQLGQLADLLLNRRPDWAELLLFIDQFEELFTLVAPPHQNPFSALLAAAAKTPRVRIVATLRADFYAACLQPELAKLLQAGHYPLVVPGPATLHEMITEPARRAGLAFDDGLVERVLNDTGTAPGALALMAAALAELYERRNPAGMLTHMAYDRFEGVQGVISKRAEETYQTLDGNAKAAFDRVFTALVDVDPERGVPVRKRLRRSGFGDSPATLRLLDAFTQARLLVASEDQVEVAHEALFSAWKTLRDWIDVHREQLKAGRDLEKAAQEWQALGKPWSDLASGVRLKRYRQAIAPSPLAREFLRVSQRLVGWRHSGVGIAAVVVAISIWLGWLNASGLTARQGILQLRAIVGLYLEPEMVTICEGEFWMGSGDDDPKAEKNEKPRHQVKIAKPFTIGKYEVTFDEYDQFTLATGRPLLPDQGGDRRRRAVTGVTWEDAVAYAKWLSEKTGKAYRLPSEAEWEYAARAGTQTRYSFGNDDDGRELERYAWFKKNSDGQAHPVGQKESNPWQAHPVGQKESNPWGLYDMHGNVWEWVEDLWHDNFAGAPGDGSAWDGGKGGDHTVRGGGWFNTREGVRSASRDKGRPGPPLYDGGFRLARTLPNLPQASLHPCRERGFE